MAPFLKQQSVAFSKNKNGLKRPWTAVTKDFRLCLWHFIFFLPFIFYLEQTRRNILWTKFATKYIFFCSFLGSFNFELGKGNLSFCCMGLTDPNFWQIRIITMKLFNTSIFLFLIFIFLLMQSFSFWLQ